MSKGGGALARQQQVEVDADTELQLARADARRAALELAALCVASTDVGELLSAADASRHAVGRLYQAAFAVRFLTSRS
jgi:hypothetical protein